MSFQNWLLIELDQRLSTALKNWAGNNDLPFDNLFGNDKRIIIPFNFNKTAVDINQKLNQIGKPNYVLGILNIDNKRAYKIGKFILGSNKFTEEEKNWWIKDGQPLVNLKTINDNKNLSIIVSRDPIDVVRMSDHSNWASCHSSDGSYFSCAVSEAKGNGLVAYVVNTDDIKKIDLNQDEIFADGERAIKGIQPLSRIRLRKFVHKDDDYELAIPEKRIYGDKITGLRESLRDWAFNSQKTLLNGERPSINDFYLTGGSYQDNNAGALFNTFFNDNKDSAYATVDYRNEEGEEEGLSLRSQYEEEIKEIVEAHNKASACKIFTHIEEEDHLTINAWTTLVFYLPSKPERDINIHMHLIQEWLEKNKDFSFVKDNLDHHAGINCEFEGDELKVEIYSMLDHPDDVSSFASNVRDIENKYGEITNDIYNFLIQNRILQPNYYKNIERSLDSSHFHNFAVTKSDEGSIEFSLKEPINLGSDLTRYLNQSSTNNHFMLRDLENKLKYMVNRWLTLIVRNVRQKYLFITHRPTELFFSIEPNLKIKFIHPNFYIDFVLEFHFNHEDEAIKQSLQALNYIDQNFDKFEEYLIKQINH